MLSTPSCFPTVSSPASLLLTARLISVSSPATWLLMIAGANDGSASPYIFSSDAAVIVTGLLLIVTVAFVVNVLDVDPTLTVVLQYTSYVPAFLNVGMVDVYFPSSSVAYCILPTETRWLSSICLTYSLARFPLL